MYKEDVEEENLQYIDVDAENNVTKNKVAAAKKKSMFFSYMASIKSFIDAIRSFSNQAHKSNVNIRYPKKDLDSESSHSRLLIGQLLV